MATSQPLPADARRPLGSAEDEPAPAVSGASPAHPSDTGLARLDARMPVLAAACLACVALLGLVGGALSVGERLGRLSPVLAGVFYVLLAALVLAGVALPVARVLARPVFSLYRLRDERGHARRLWCRRLASGLARNVELTPVQRERMEHAVRAGDAADDELIALVHEVCEPRIDARIKVGACRAFAATAVSQTAVYDTLSMLSINLELVRGIVSELGFRPTNLALARLYARVLAGAFLAGGLEELDLEEMMPAMLGRVKVPGVLLASATQGAVNAFSTYRVGVITKRWLLAADGPARMAELRHASYGEALRLMREGGFASEAARMVAARADAVRAGAWESAKGVAGRAWSGLRGRERQDGASPEAS